jgi:hypothetical protein
MFKLPIQYFAISDESGSSKTTAERTSLRKVDDEAKNARSRKLIRQENIITGYKNLPTSYVNIATIKTELNDILIANRHSSNIDVTLYWSYTNLNLLLPDADITSDPETFYLGKHAATALVVMSLFAGKFSISTNIRTDKTIYIYAKAATADKIDVTTFHKN